MIKFKDIDENLLCVYGTGSMKIFSQVKVVSTTTYENGPALIVRKEKAGQKEKTE